MQKDYFENGSQIQEGQKLDIHKLPIPSEERRGSSLKRTALTAALTSDETRCIFLFLQQC